ncbi:hypothetical protein [Paenibacillus lautus]|uniref:hypothetical protein n=1 Tax=Paenibacillus lautus TaxID=1401 RepID=UPI002DB8FF69|nr:hypothetical protein [Paenibacillus lautus]MEC0257333.1 hypothetical protein [Paenibacillus lautus]
MSKKRAAKRKIKKKKIQSLNGMLKPEYVLQNNPLYDIPLVERQKIIQYYAQSQVSIFEEKLQELINKIRHFDILSLVCWFSLYGLTAPEGKNPETYRKEPILQYHIELLQALSLRNTYEYSEIRPVLSGDARDVYLLLKDVTQSFNARTFAKISEDQVDNKQLYIVQSMQTHTMAVRNAGYFDQVLKMVRDIFQPIDIKIKDQLGVSVIGLLTMLEKLLDRVEERISHYLKGVSKIWRAKTIADIVNSYLEFRPDALSSKEELIKMGSKVSSHKELAHILVSHCDLTISDIFTFTLDEFVQLYPEEVEKSILNNILSNWSLQYGELTEANINHFFLANPIWEKPFIKINNEQFAFPIPSMINHFGLNMLENVFFNNAGLKEIYEKRRADYLEEEIEKLFLKGFPDASVLRGNIWRDEEENKDYENDILVIIDSYAIVIEAKAGKISESAKRGSIDRLKREVKKLIVEPSIQAKRFSKFLQSQKSVITLSHRNGKDLEIDLSGVRHVLTLGVILELFGPLGSHISEFIKAGLVSSNEDLSPNIPLIDLEIIFDLLETSCEKIHYLSRRDSFERNATYTADEIDLVVFYLQTGFNIGETEFEGQPMILYGASTELDDYYLRKSGALKNKVKKPRPRRTKWWNDIINRLENSKFPRWTEVAYSLLNVTYEDQVQFERMCKRIKQNEKFARAGQKIDNMIILDNGPIQRKDLIMAVAYKNLSREERNIRIENAASDGFEQTSNDTCTMIGLNTEREDYPYSVLAILQKAEYEEYTTLGSLRGR